MLQVLPLSRSSGGKTEDSGKEGRKEGREVEKKKERSEKGRKKEKALYPYKVAEKKKTENKNHTLIPLISLLCN